MIIIIFRLRNIDGNLIRHDFFKFIGIAKFTRLNDGIDSSNRLLMGHLLYRIYKDQDDRVR